jgi:hypothetical protein
MLLLILLPFTICAQVDTIKHGTIKIEKEYTQADYFPRINGNYGGEISSAELCESKGIEFGAPVFVKSFVLKCSYFKNKEGMVSNGAMLTEEMCKALNALPEGAIIHIEAIKAVNEKGQALRISSLRYAIKNKD